MNRLTLRHKMFELLSMLTFGVLSFSQDSFCETKLISGIINVDYYHITEFQNGFEVFEAVELFKKAKEKIKYELRIRLRLRKIEVLNKAPYQYIENLNLASRQSEILDAKKFLRNKRTRGQRTISLINRGPIETGGAWWITGIASSICDPRGAGLLFTTPKNYEGFSRVKESEIIFIHEIGHLLGARHDAGTVMDPGALQLSLAGVELNFSERNRKEVRRCLG